MTNSKRKLHNLRCFVKHNPKATVSDYAKDIKAGKRLVQGIERAYGESLNGNK